jgi:hypothetical protein
MYRFASASVLAVGLVFSPMAFAADPSPAPNRPNEVVYTNVAGPAEVPNAPAGDDTMVCNYQHETGSLLVTRVCRTLRAWKTMQSDSQEFLQFDHLGAHQAGEHG